jgi:aspartyl-tRNA synthetase
MSLKTNKTHLLKIKGIEVDKFPDATYGNDKPDIRFGMEFGELNEVAKQGISVFNTAGISCGYCTSVEEIIQGKKLMH